MDPRSFLTSIIIIFKLLFNFRNKWDSRYKSSLLARQHRQISVYLLSERFFWVFIHSAFSSVPRRFNVGIMMKKNSLKKGREGELFTGNPRQIKILRWIKFHSKCIPDTKAVVSHIKREIRARIKRRWKNDGEWSVGRKLWSAILWSAFYSAVYSVFTTIFACELILRIFQIFRLKKKL